MEHIQGIRLSERWDTMSVVEHLRCVNAISLMMAEMAAITFPAYGSLYFSDAPIDSQHKIELGDRFCLGPNCGIRYWSFHSDKDSISRAGKNKNRGPCECSSIFSNSVLVHILTP
jgi:hypothetical protein